MKKFKDLTLKGQKMRIVRDAIAQIKNGVIIPDRSTYFAIADQYFGKNLQTILKTGDVECTACAKGTLFVACVLNVNKVNINENTDSEYRQKDKLSKWFSAGELDTIEAAFELRVINDTERILIYRPYSIYYTDLAKRAILFGDKYSTAKKRLLAILKNILKHGTFKP